MVQIITRAQATKLGLVRYYSGQPCKYGHITERLAKYNQCVGCSEERNAVSRDHFNELSRRSLKRHPETRVRNRVFRTRRLRLCTPHWVDRNRLVEFYLMCPKGWHVDHIVPIKGLTPQGWEVSGLHLPCNLQYLTASENSSKGNRMSHRDYAIAITHQY
jgi:hypothetical protein